jgi:hypothetical protein
MTPDVRTLKTAFDPEVRRAGCSYNAESQHNICGLFQNFWRSHGGYSRFGHPLTEEFETSGIQMQYFEYALFEQHPEYARTEYEVLLARLGAYLANRRVVAETIAAEPEYRPGCTFMEVTEHNICGPFAAYWNAYGDLLVFGYPVTEQFTEDGRLVQYFERARFEFHPGSAPDSFDIILTPLGKESITMEVRP